MKYWDDSSKDFFDINGYVIIENVLSSSECDYIRNIVLQLAKWEKDSNAAHIYDKDPSYLINEEMRDVWDGKVLKKLRNIHLKGRRFDIDPCQGCTMNEYSEKDNIDDMADVIYKKINNIVKVQ